MTATDDLIERLKVDARECWQEAAAELTRLRDDLSQSKQEQATNALLLIGRAERAEAKHDKWYRLAGELEAEARRLDHERNALRADAESTRQELASESSERLKLLRRFEQVAAELLHLEQAYSNKHSPQHRAAALNSAQVTLAAIDAARGQK